MAASSYTDLRALCAANVVNPIKLARLFDTSTNKGWREFEPDELYAAAGIDKDDQFKKDLMCATQMAATNPDCFDDWHAFHHVATVFNHRRASFEFLDAISYIEAAWACTVLKTLNPHHEFGLGVQRYLSALCMTDGVIFFPWIGGHGLSLCTFYPLKGLLEPRLNEVSDEVRKTWESGALAALEPSDVDDHNPTHVQLAKLVSAESYIRENLAC